jgi:7-carboxy-7-deazaguanine synthase
MALGDILRECERIGGGCKHLCLTGGEPLDQTLETEAFVKLAARVYEYSVEVETSGCVLLPEERWPCSWIVDIKTPSTGVSDRNIGCNLQQLDWNHGDAVVAVIHDRIDFEYTIDFADKFLNNFVNLYFHPDSSVADFSGLLKDLATWLKKEHGPKNWRMGYQLHRLIWGVQIGV